MNERSLYVLLMQAIESALGDDDPLQQKEDVANAVFEAFPELHPDDRRNLYVRMERLLETRPKEGRCWSAWTRTLLAYGDPTAQYEDYLNIEFAPRYNTVVTYFIQAVDGGPVKIGKTNKAPVSRLNALQTGNHARLRITRVVNADLEELLHKRFAHLRLSGEWFSLNEELALVANVRSSEVLSICATREERTP